ncbi:unnamed protein product [Psylliodes chrysocephalus]|uniref:Uncharacterized protein n=1 Tax=Psylliodes chrysocephalus TaxID=3402493 RepID=A0A9P0CI49_9CUCU|nr:unnamed protein product [Psylliodes chrysocephala]
MKVLVILSLVALCYSTPIAVHKRVTIEEDGTITIKGTHGSELDIYKSVIDPTKLNIIIKSQLGVARKIQIDNKADIKDVNFNSLDARFFKNIPRDKITQDNILVHIFREYEGLVDEPTYKILLDRIETLVKEGFLHEAILEALKTLDQLRMVKDLKEDEAQDLMDDIVKEKLAKDAEYPVEKFSQWHRASSVTPAEGLFGRNQYRNDLPVQGYHGVQGLWDTQNWTPNKRQMLLQHMRQMQYGEDLGELSLIEMLKEQELERELAHQQIMQQIYEHQFRQTEMSPLNRYLYKLRALKGQRSFNPQQLRVPKFQWGQLENRYQNEDFPQEFESLVEQGRFLPQQFDRFQQDRFIPQDTDFQQQHGYRRFPMSY